jgi:hypothetical protein
VDPGPEEVGGSGAKPQLSSPAPAARLIPLEAGTQLEGERPPTGWTHVVIKSIPRLASGDLDTVSEQAFEIAQRIRPLILAKVWPTAEPGAPYRLDRVGVGLCAPGAEGQGDIVVSSTSVEKTRGAWTTKQRLILAAMSLETSRADLAAATSTFALVRSPVTFLVSGAHKKINLYYAILVDPQTGSLRTVVWPDHEKSESNPSPAVTTTTMARHLSVTVFDLPQDVRASRILGNIPVSWSFAISALPKGNDLVLPPDLSAVPDSGTQDAAMSARMEQALVRSLESKAAETELATLPR